jgi:hypothetical protein
MTENNAAQPGLTDDDILQVFSDVVGNQEDDARFIDVDRDQAIRIARALLSKLRAEGVQAGDERAIDAAALLGKYKKLCIEIGRGDSHHLGRIDVAIAALASVPVAGVAVAWEDVRDSLAMFLSGATGKASKHWVAPLEDATASGPLSKMRAALASAPVAGERACKTCGGSRVDPGGLSICRDCGAAPQASKPDFADAYEGAREDLAIWKRRALEAERDLRAERETSSRLVAALNAGNGPTHMGEPAPQASEAVLEAVQFVLKNFKASEAQGYHTRDRQFAINILEQALSAQPGAQRTGGSDE